MTDDITNSCPGGTTSFPPLSDPHSLHTSLPPPYVPGGGSLPQQLDVEDAARSRRLVHVNALVLLFLCGRLMARRRHSLINQTQSAPQMNPGRGAPAFRAPKGAAAARLRIDLFSTYLCKYFVTLPIYHPRFFSAV